METKEKAISLFRYIMELYSQKYPIITDICKQYWYEFLRDIPKDDENIVLNYMDRTDNDDEVETTKNIILKVHKPEFEDCPPLPKSLEKWVEEGWDRYNNDVINKDSIYVKIKGQTQEVYFKDDANRVSDFNNWEVERAKWAIRQQSIAQTRNFFTNLYYNYIDLNRDSETIELMIGQGVLKCTTDNGERISHPILLKRVILEFDSFSNTLYIVDSNTESEIYTMLFQRINYVNHSEVKTLKDELLENFYHPLDRNDTPDYLKSFAHRLHSESKYSEYPIDNLSIYEKLIIYNDPVFFIRRRTGGVIKALEEIIGEIERTGEISGPLSNLIGENVPQLVNISETFELSESLAAINGEDKDILLSKEANKEQLEIAKRIENYNAVLVQGPPGTGKTHTIANLVGHFLAQGKNILVTSHTKKALSVVKDKVVPELQNLCVSVLEDNNKDMERSIDGITEYISSHSSLELLENINKIKSRREKIIEELAEVRNKIFSIKYKEYETIIFGGKGYSTSEAARFVYENKDRLSYIPGRVTLNKPLPVTVGDLELLYKTNSEVSIVEEIELKKLLPNPVDLISPSEFITIVEQYNDLINYIVKIQDQLYGNIEINIDKGICIVQGESLCINPNFEKIAELENVILKSSKYDYNEWQKYAILDGKKGGGFKTVWEKLITQIKDTYNFAGDIAVLTIGKKLSANEEVSEKTVNVLKDIKEHLSIGKKITSLTFIVRKDWKLLYQSLKLNDKQIESAKDCEVLIALIELYLKRKSISELWTELIEKRGGTPFAEFGAEPEQACISYVAQIENCLVLYENIFMNIKELITECGFSKTIIESGLQYNQPLEEINYLVKLTYSIFPKYIEAVKLVYFNIPEIKGKIDNCIKILTDNNLKSSAICQNLVSCLTQMDTTNYSVHYNVLEQLYLKYYYQTNRFRILNDISEYAPEWANLIRNRIGIHGENVVPNNIEDAWKWKQFAGIIDDITAMPFEELQHKLVVLNNELRKTTALLAEYMSWYNLLIRIEGDISKKQALQGWKLTEKKIGKGTGKTAPALKREAQKLMAKCQTSVPAWIMPVNKALESLDPTHNKFDIVIIDEASQSDVSALAIMYLAKKIIIVGDDEQVSPSGIGTEVDKVNNLADMYIKGIIPNAHLYDMKSSLYDIAKTTFPTLMLKEHFRCVPSIIGYCNRLSYDYKIKPLRDDSNVELKPATISYKVNGVRNRNKINEIEAKNIAALILACIKHPEYNNMTFGAISLLGDSQSKLINKLLIEKMSPQEYEKRQILCGNASNFQGDERDVIFISLVDSNEGEGPLRISGEGVGKQTKQRYNVAVSRAKNQLWVVHSLDANNDLKSGDIRKDLIEYVTDPDAFNNQIDEITAKADSPFEISVAKALVLNGYHIKQQWPVGSYKIDMVALCGDKKIAIECDGELCHSGEEKIREDMERQAILERLGWRFIRIRGSEYYGNPKETIDRVVRELAAYEIEPEQNIDTSKDKSSELKKRVVIAANRILDEWEKEDEEDSIAEYEFSLNDSNYKRIIMLK